MYFHFCFCFFSWYSCTYWKFAATININVITTEIKKYKSIIKKKKEKHDKVVLLAKTKLSTIRVLISKTLIDSNISHGEFFLANSVLK